MNGWDNDDIFDFQLTIVDLRGRIMFYVLDEERGRVDICEPSPDDIEHIILILKNAGQDRTSPHIRYHAIRLAAELSPADYKMAWADVFLIAQLLMTVAYSADVTDDMVTKRQADRLLNDFEAATKRICKSV